MSRSAIDPRNAAGGGRGGFTLLEISVALALSGILVSGLAYFFKAFGRSFNLQEQIAERDLNAHYTLKRLSEALMAAGADLPSQGWQVIAPAGGPAGGVRLSVNPRGGVQYVAGPVSGRDLPLDDAKGFAAARAVLVDPRDPAGRVSRIAVDAGYGRDGYAGGIRTGPAGAYLRLASEVSLDAGDVVYALAEEEYRLVGTNLMLGDMVLAEDIEHLDVTFHTAGRAPTAQWSDMRSARILVRARTRLPDPGLSRDGGFRRIELSTDVMLRNRL